MHGKGFGEGQKIQNVNLQYLMNMCPNHSGIQLENKAYYTGELHLTIF